MIVTIKDVRTEIYIDGKLTDVQLTIEIDTDRLSDAARRAYVKADGIATWSDRAFRATIQDEGHG